MISFKGLKRLKALALTKLEKNGLEFNEMEHHGNLCIKIEICPAQPIFNQS